MKNQTHQLPKRLKLVFSNGVADEMGFKKFTYIHECDNDLSSNIFDGNKFKIQMKNIPLVLIMSFTTVNIVCPAKALA